MKNFLCVLLFLIGSIIALLGIIHYNWILWVIGIIIIVSIMFFECDNYR